MHLNINFFILGKKNWSYSIGKNQLEAVTEEKNECIINDKELNLHGNTQLQAAKAN